MFDLQPVTIGTSGLGKRPEADLALATAILTSPFLQADTSNNYADGESERLLGQAISELGGLPEGHVVFSKGDQDPVTGAFSGDRMRRSFEESTERLGLETLPLYQLHDPYNITVAEAMAPGGAVDVLLKLRDQGRIDKVGVAAGKIPLMEEYVKTDAFDVVLTHNRYTVVNRQADNAAHNDLPSARRTTHQGDRQERQVGQNQPATKPCKKGAPVPRQERSGAPERQGESGEHLYCLASSWLISS